MICPHCRRDTDHPTLTPCALALRKHLGEWSDVSYLAATVGFSASAVRQALKAMQAIKMVKRNAKSTTAPPTVTFWRLVRK